MFLFSKSTSTLTPYSHRRWRGPLIYSFFTSVRNGAIYSAHKVGIIAPTERNFFSFTKKKGSSLPQKEWTSLNPEDGQTPFKFTRWEVILTSTKREGFFSSTFDFSYTNINQYSWYGKLIPSSIYE